MQVPRGWIFEDTVRYGATLISVYKVGSSFGGFVPISCYTVVADSRSEVINECRAECDRYFAKEQVFDDIPF